MCGLGRGRRRQRGLPLLGQLRVLVLLDDVDEQVADAELSRLKRVSSRLAWGRRVWGVSPVWHTMVNGLRSGEVMPASSACRSTWMEEEVEEVVVVEVVEVE